MKTLLTIIITATLSFGCAMLEGELTTTDTGEGQYEHLQHQLLLAGHGPSNWMGGAQTNLVQASAVTLSAMSM